LDQGSIKKRDIIIARGARGRTADDKWMSSPDVDELRRSAVRLELTEDGSLELINELIGASDRSDVQRSREPFFIQLYSYTGNHGKRQTRTIARTRLLMLPLCEICASSARNRTRNSRIHLRRRNASGRNPLKAEKERERERERERGTNGAHWNKPSCRGCVRRHKEREGLRCANIGGTRGTAACSVIHHPLSMPVP